MGDRHPLPRGLSISRSLAMICSIESFFVVTGYPLLVLTFSLGLTEKWTSSWGPDTSLYSRYGDCVANQHEFRGRR